MTDKTFKELLEAIAFTGTPKRFELRVPQGIEIKVPAKIIAQTETVRTLAFDDHLLLEHAVVELIIQRGEGMFPTQGSMNFWEKNIEEMGLITGVEFKKIKY